MWQTGRFMWQIFFICHILSEKNLPHVADSCGRLFSICHIFFFLFHGLHTLLLVDVQPMDLLAGRLGRDWWVFILKVWGPVLVGTHLWQWNEPNGDLSRPSPSTSSYIPLTKPDTTGDRTRDLLIVKRTRRPLGHD